VLEEKLTVQEVFGSPLTPFPGHGSSCRSKLFTSMGREDNGVIPTGSRHPDILNQRVQQAIGLGNTVNIYILDILSGIRSPGQLEGGRRLQGDV